MLFDTGINDRYNRDLYLSLRAQKDSVYIIAIIAGDRLMTEILLNTEDSIQTRNRVKNRKDFLFIFLCISILMSLPDQYNSL